MRKAERRPPARALRLARLQSWFQAEITGLEEGSRRAARRTARDVVRPSRTLAPEERIDIYSRMYFARLHECLVADFPSVLAILGPDAFERLARAYLARFPSRHYSLNALGKDLPRFLAGPVRVRKRALVRDVARLELAMSEVFDEEERPALAPRDLEALPADRWDEARLALIPALRVLALDHRASDIVTAVRQERPLPPLGRRPSFTVVYRKELVIWRLDVSASMFAVLEAMVRGKSLAAAIRAGARRFEGRPEELERAVASWFRTFGSEGLIASVAAPGLAIVPGRRARKRIRGKDLAAGDTRAVNERGNRAY